MIGWYLNRLRTFSVAEFPYRFRQLVQKKIEQYFYAGKSTVPYKECHIVHIKEFSPAVVDTYPEEVNIFGRILNYSRKNIDLQRDIFSGNSFLLTFAKNINIRSNPDLSAKNVWEVNRLLFLPQIALNYKKKGDKKYLERFKSIIVSWIDNNPYLMGVNWYSNIEVNIRLINWFLSWEILDAEKLTESDESFKLFAEKVWLPAIYQHCRYSYKNPSKYSSSNNHLIAEYSGLFLASSLWKFKESNKWLLYSRNGLEKEIVRQHSSGINKEEAAEYIQFITDFFVLPFIVGERTGDPFSKKFKDTLYEIFSYILTMLDSNGNFPKYGDEDDGKCVLFDTDETFNNFRSLLSSAAIIFGDPQFKAAGNGLDNKNKVLFGDEGIKKFNAIPAVPRLNSSVFYKEQGHFFFKNDFRGKSIFFHFDAAPLGFLSIAAHGHADALSFIMHIDGQPVFIDSGTYTYHTEPEWRQYFIGTLAHNTVRINSHNQALSGGPTLWLNHFKTSVSDVQSDETFESVKASHNGYRNEKVNHLREVVFDKKNGEFTITDTIVSEKGRPVKVEIPFHLHPAINITASESDTYILAGGSSPLVMLKVDSKLNQEKISGQVTPQILGWYSESFLKKTATNVIYCSAYIDETTTFKFVIKII